MFIDSDTVISTFGLKLFGAKGWRKSKSTPCPYCGNKEKFGFLFSGSGGGVVHCFVCGTKKSIVSYLFDVERTDLLEHDKNYSIKTGLKRELVAEKDVFSVQLPVVKQPYGSRNIKSSKYLSNRNFNEHHYRLFKPFIVDDFLLRKYEGYIFFKIFQGGEMVAWLARSKRSKEWHKQNLELFKLGKTSELSLRYENSTGTEFDRILGGIDEVTCDTHTVIIVEGIFDKVNVDTLLRLNSAPDTKCLFTFGSKFSDTQMKLLRAKPSVKNLVLMYDPDAYLLSKEYGVNSLQYWNTSVAQIPDPNIDPGSIELPMLLEVLGEAKPAFQNYIKTIRRPVWK